MTVERVFVGASATIEATFDARTVRLFAEVTGDKNPIHLDAEFAASTRFGRTLVHGALVAAQFSRGLAERLPGPGTIYVEQNSRFVRPIFVGDTVQIVLSVTSWDPTTRTAVIRTECLNPAGKPAVQGHAVVLVPLPTEST